MGWWSTNKYGESFSKDPGDPEMLWGDSVADTLDEALGSIIKDFQQDWGRTPTLAELHAGLDFSARGMLEEIRS